MNKSILSQTHAQIASDYIAHGFALAPIKPGTKQPRGSGWQYKPASAEHWERNPSDGMGIIHHLSGTCSIDIDDIESSRLALAAIDIDMDALLDNGVQIISRAGRAKLLYRAPATLPQMRHALNWPNKDDGDGGTYCVIEFRAGKVQDVLPPSIHPDTGEPYKWGGSVSWEDLPELPATLLPAWINWDLAKSAMADACPWRKVSEGIPAKVKTRDYGGQSYGGGVSVIASFNDSHDIGSILEQHSYKRAGGRWRYPHSTTGIPGVVLLPDTSPQRIYSHHGSDPLGDGYAHDAFSIFCQLDFNGDVTAAVREAAHILGIVREEDKEGYAAADEFIKNMKSMKNADVEMKPMATVSTLAPPRRDDDEERVYEPTVIDAPHPGEIPCEMGRMVYDFLESKAGFDTRPDAIMQATIGYLCFAASRRYETPDGQPVSVFLGCVSSSVAGLLGMKSDLTSIMEMTNDRASSINGQISSDYAFHKALFRTPRLFWKTEQYGYMVQTARRQPSGAMESALSAVNTCYQGKTEYPNIDSVKIGNKDIDPEDCKIIKPAVTVFALLPNEHLSTIGQRGELSRGTINRMMIIPAGRHCKPSNGGCTIDAGFISKYKRMTEISGGGNFKDLYRNEPKIKTVLIGKDAKCEFSESFKRMREFMLKDSRTQFSKMAYGYNNSSKRIACAIAASINPENPVVDEGTAKWTTRWAERCLYLTVPLIEVTVTDSEKIDVMQTVKALLYSRSRYMTIREMAKTCRPLEALDSTDREKVLALLVEDGIVISKKENGTVKYISKTLKK